MSEAIPPPPDPRALLDSAGLRAKKSWGQNFLHDQGVLADIAAATGAGPDVVVLELGAGLGALTYHLLARGGRVAAVERDREMIPLLREALAWAGDRFELLEADAASIDYGAEAVRLSVPGALTVAGNLPYQIGSRILVDVAGAHHSIVRAVFMIQKEVAERLTAAPGSKTYGLLSVLVRRSLDARMLRVVKPGAFIPRPKIDSAVVQLVPHGRAPEPGRDEHMVAAARAAFAQRRKTLRNSVAGSLGLPASEVAAALQTAGLDPGARAETLPVEAFAAMGDALAAAGLLGGGTP